MHRRTAKCSKPIGIVGWTPGATGLGGCRGFLMFLISSHACKHVQACGLFRKKILHETLRRVGTRSEY